MRTWSVHWW